MRTQSRQRGWVGAAPTLPMDLWVQGPGLGLEPPAPEVSLSWEPFLFHCCGRDEEGLFPTSGTEPGLAVTLSWDCRGTGAGVATGR